MDNALLQVRSMSKLRTRLVLMSLIGILPALAAILYTQSAERESARGRTLEEQPADHAPRRPPAGRTAEWRAATAA